MFYRYEDLKVGDSNAFEKTISEADILLFSAVSGDTNPLHCDEKYAKTTKFGRRIAHGALSNALISTALTRTFPTSIYISQHTEFVAPVYIGNTIRAGILTDDSIPEKYSRVLGRDHSHRIDTMVKSLTRGTRENFEKGISALKMESEVEEATMGLREFMFENVYINSLAKKEESKACDLLAAIWRYFVAHPEKMPEDNRKHLDAFSVERVVCDYIAGMTDRYALEVYNELFIPRMWGR